MTGPASIGIVVGLEAEARIAQRLGAVVAVGSGTADGASAACARLIAQGVRGLISFGLAGGLDPALRPGALVVPRCVLSGDERFDVDPGLAAALGGCTTEALYGAIRIVVHAEDKARLWRTTGAACADLETDAVARAAMAAGIPFAVLRAICDPAERTLPPAALLALDGGGRIGLLRIAASVLRHPRQFASLLALARDAAAARRALLDRVQALGPTPFAS